MKQLFTWFCAAAALTGSLSAQADSSIDAGGKQPDIIMQTVFDNESSDMSIQRLRTLLVNSGIQDPFNLEFPATYTLSYALVGESMTQKQKDFLKNLSELIGMDLKKSRFVFTIKGIKYNIKNVVSDIKPENMPDGTLEAAGKLKLSGIDVSTHEVGAELVLSPEGEEIPVPCFNPEDPADPKQIENNCDIHRKKLVRLFHVKLVEPWVTTAPNEPLPFSCRIAVNTGDQFGFVLKESSFEAFKKHLDKNPGMITLSPLQFEGIPDVSLNVGTKRKITVSAKQIEDYIQSQRTSIQSALIARFADGVQNGLGESLLGLVFQQKVPSDMWISSSVYSGIKPDRVYALPGNQVAFDASGSFCSPDEFKRDGEACADYQFNPEPVRQLTEDDFAESRKVLSSELSKKDANFVLGISEQYVNRLLYKTVEMKFFEDALLRANPEGRLKLGPKKVFMVMDKFGPEGTFYMDMIYHLPKFYRLLMGTKYLRFPVVYKVVIYFKNKKVGTENIPIFTVKITGSDVSKRTLSDGIPELDYKSKLGGILRKKVMKYIRGDDNVEGQENKNPGVNSLIGSEVLSFDVPILKNLGLENVKFYSDGHGRAVAKLKIVPEKNENYFKSLKYDSLNMGKMKIAKPPYRSVAPQKKAE